MLNLRSVTILFIAALAYEIVLKLSWLLFPALVSFSGLRIITAVMNILVALVLLAYAARIYLLESDKRTIRISLQLLFVVLCLHVLLRLPMIRPELDFTLARLMDHTLSVCISVLILIFFLQLYRSMASELRALRLTILGMLAIFALNAGLGLYKAGQFVYFMRTGISQEPTALFMGLMMLLFMVTRLASMLFAILYLAKRTG